MLYCFGMASGSYILIEFKNLGAQATKDDFFLTAIGFIGNAV
jgi:hypothetical protein